MMTYRKVCEILEAVEVRLSSMGLRESKIDIEFHEVSP